MMKSTTQKQEFEMGNPQVKVTLEVIADTVEDALARLGLGAIDAAVKIRADGPKAEKPKASKPKAQKPKTEPEPAKTEPEPAKTEPEPAVKKKDVEVALRSFIRQGGQDGVKNASAILKKFNATTIHNLDPTNYAAVLDLIGGDS